MGRRQLVREVELVFFQENRNGEWGVAPGPTVGPAGNFNAVWDGGYIFHDVFEHAHEGSEYFSGINMMNIGGEMAASGALYYFTEDLGVRRFTGVEQHVRAADALEQNSLDLIEEACVDGIVPSRPGSVTGDYERSLESGVPAQPPLSDATELDAVLDRYWSKVTGFRCRAVTLPEQEFAHAYRASVTRQKINDLHRWGWREARRLVPKSQWNRAKLDSFISFWSEFCVLNPAGRVAARSRSLTFKVFRRGLDVEWACDLEHHDGSKTPVYPVPSSTEQPTVDV
jgi:hypothetical protein